MMQYSIEPRTRKYVIKYTDFYHLQGNINKKELLDKGLHAVKKVVHKLGEYLVNKIADAITKSNDDNIEKHEPVEGIIISPEKREEI